MGEWTILIVLSLIIGVLGPVYLTAQYACWGKYIDEIKNNLSRDPLFYGDQSKLMTPYLNGEKKWSSISNAQLYYFFLDYAKQLASNLSIKTPRSIDEAIGSCLATSHFLAFLFFIAISLIAAPFIFFYLVCIGAFKNAKKNTLNVFLTIARTCSTAIGRFTSFRPQWR